MILESIFMFMSWNELLKYDFENVYKLKIEV